MFVRKTTRTYKGRNYANYLLVESVRTPKGPRQKTLCSLGNLAPRPAGEWLKLAHRVEQALAGQDDRFDSADAQDDRITVRTAAVRTEKNREAGPVAMAAPKRTAPSAKSRRRGCWPISANCRTAWPPAPLATRSKSASPSDG